MENSSPIESPHPLLHQPVGNTYHLVFAALCLAVSAGLAYLMAYRRGVISIGLSFGLVVGVSLVVKQLQKRPDQYRWLGSLTIGALVGVLVLSRLGDVGADITGLSIASAEWVGLSYLIFRLISVVVDYRKLGSVSVADMTTYALFPATLIAGPITRVTQFIPQISQSRRTSSPTRMDSLWRIAVGTFKKLALANGFGYFALNPAIVANPYVGTGVLWATLIAYSFMIYFDFSGYSDIVIGAAGLIGITLPENFANPYLQPNIERFWQAWHITLSNWLRDYLFFPVSRTLLSRLGSRWSVVVMLIAYLITMGLAGLWHGFAIGFLLWGLWHGVGLFVHAQWSRIARRRGWKIPTLIGIPLTFLFVSIGWVFFALPDLPAMMRFLLRLFGLST